MDSARAGAALRWLRALVLAAVAWTAGIAGHVGADGRLPGAPVLALLFLTTALAAAPLLGREVGRAAAIGLLVAGQTLIHGCLTALSSHDLPAEHAGVNAAHQHQSVAEPGWAHHPHHLLGDLSGQHAAMALAHLAAAVVVGWWLAAGERALWTVLRSVAGPGVAAVRSLLAGLRPRPAAAWGARRTPEHAALDEPAPVLVVLAHVVRRRGPPVLVR